MRAALFLMVLGLSASAAVGPHPRIWLTPQLLADWKAKACAGAAGTPGKPCRPDPDWLAIKKNADIAADSTFEYLTIASATQTNPVVFTTSHPIPFIRADGSQFRFYIGNATGCWAPLNTPYSRMPGVVGTKLTANTFKVDFDARSCSFAGQNWTTFANFLGGCPNNVLCYDYQGLSWLSAGKELLVAWKVTGEEKYRRRAVEMLDFINNRAAANLIQFWTIDSGYPSRSVLLILGLIYDWAYDTLTPAQKAATGVTAGKIWDFYQKHIENGEIVYQPRNAPLFNYWGGHIVGLGALGYATAGDNPHGQVIADAVYRDFTKSMNAALQPPQDGWLPNGSDECGPSLPCGGSLVGGYPSEGFGYGIAHFQRLLQTAWMIRTATGEDLLQTPRYTAWTNAIAKTLIYDLKPDRWRWTNYGDSGIPGVATNGGALLLACLRQGSEESRWMQFWLGNLAAPPNDNPVLKIWANSEEAAANWLKVPLDSFLYRRPGLPEADYRKSLPPFYFSVGDGKVYWRSDWSDDAVWTVFNAAPVYMAGHASHMAGHVDIQRGSDPLIISSSHWFGKEGYAGSPEYGAGDTQNFSFANSTLFFDDRKEYSYGYAGGQMNWGAWKTPAVKLSPESAYVEADLTTAYDIKPSARGNGARRTLRYFFRTWIALGDGTFVVYDRIRAKDPSYTKKLYFYVSGAGGAPTVSGATATTAVGSSRIFISSLLPAKPVLTVAQNKGATPYRIEISDSASGTDLNAATVLYATSSVGTARATALLSNVDANWVGLQIADKTPKVVVLPRSIRDNGNNTYSAPLLRAASFTTSHVGSAKYLVGGLQPGRYSVRSKGAEIVAAQPVGGDGVLSFSGPAGDYQISVAGAPR